MTDTEQIIEDSLALMCSNYVFPDRAEEMASTIRARYADGAYADLDEGALCERLTADLFELSDDKHLRIRRRDAPLPPAEGSASQEEQDWYARIRARNYGISRVERLDGNIGYLDLRMVTEATIGAPAITAAMALVERTDALVIDLRRNGGGSPDGVIYWCSYLFAEGDGVHLNSIYDGETGVTRQYWSLAYLPGRRYLDRPVYVLTSATTFSAAEEIAYNLKAQGRATLLGETTRGGAHPCDNYPVTDLVYISVPCSRSINPVTGTNWEGVGVVPDLPMPAEEAFDAAYRLALEHAVAQGSTEAEEALKAL